MRYLDLTQIIRLIQPVLLVLPTEPSGWPPILSSWDGSFQVGFYVMILNKPSILHHKGPHTMFKFFLWKKILSWNTALSYCSYPLHHFPAFPRESRILWSTIYSKGFTLIASSQNLWFEGKFNNAGVGSFPLQGVYCQHCEPIPTDKYWMETKT